MTSPIPLSLSSGSKIALGSIVGAGLAYIAYQSLRNKQSPEPSKQLAQEIDGMYIYFLNTPTFSCFYIIF